MKYFVLVSYTIEKRIHLRQYLTARADRDTI